MRFSNPAIFTAILFASGTALAAPTTGDTVATPIEFAPHKAVYEMKLDSVHAGSQVSDAEGTMTFTWADACTGWTVDQRLNLKFYYAEGDSVERATSMSTWESKDGKTYSFTTRSTANGEQVEAYRGSATMNEDGGEVHYIEPEDRTMELAANTIFPSAHTVEVIEHAINGNQFFHRIVFDGSDEKGQNEISAFIGQKIENAQSVEKDGNLKKNELLNVPGWPVRLAFFELDSETGEPSYEMDLNLLENGVAQSMLVDYGDFRLRGTLKELKKLPRSGC